MTTSNRRKTRIVDAPAQARIIAGVSLGPAVVMLAAAIAMWILDGRLFDEAGAANADLPSLGLLAVAQCFFVVATGAVLLSRALHYSHRVIGPAHRIRRALRQLRDGVPQVQIRLRKGDELVDVADEVNALIRKLGVQPERRNSRTTCGDASGASQTVPATFEEHDLLPVGDREEIHATSGN